MIETYKIITGKYDPAACEGFLVLATDTRTRGHRYKLKTRTSRKNFRLYSFACRVVKMWNSLPDDVVAADTIRGFEQQLDLHWTYRPLRLDPAAPEI